MFPRLSHLVLPLLVSVHVVFGSPRLTTTKSLSQVDDLVELGVHRRLASLYKRGSRSYTNSTSLDTSLNSAVLFHIEVGSEISNGGSHSETTAATGIEVVCNTCYIKGLATASVTLSESFNISDFATTVENVASDTLHNLTHWLQDAAEGFFDPDLPIPPPPDFDFAAELSTLPEAQLELSFANTELYVELSTIFSSGLTYRLTLYKDVLGVDLGKDLFLGFTFSVDLVLSIESEVEIQHGFHIQFDDKIVLKLAMFSKKAVDMQFKGGQFEFLPVKVVTSGTVLRAVLQLSLHAGFSIDTPELDLSGIGGPDFKASAGLEASVYVNVADFKTNLTTSSSKEDDCAFFIEQSFQFAVGAAAGAYVGIGDQIWGPQPETEIPLFPTTFTGACLPQATSLSVAARLEAKSPQGEHAAVEDGSLTTTTLRKEVTYTARLCGETGAINCPANRETLREHVETETLVTSVPSGSKATWPASVTAAVRESKSFGDGVHSITSTSGAPKPSDSKSRGNDDSTGAFFDRKTGGVSNKVIVGVSIGLGVPLLLILGVILFCLVRGRSTKKTPNQTVSR